MARVSVVASGVEENRRAVKGGNVIGGQQKMLDCMRRLLAARC
jgi:hypothetical protein